MNDIEFFIQKQIKKETSSTIQKPLNSRHEKNCNYDDFIALLENTLRNVLPNIKFVPFEEKSIFLEPDRTVKNTFITHKVINRRPLKESKPVFRHDVIEDAENGESRIGTLYAWRMFCVIQFDIFSGNYHDAQQTMSLFEDLMFDYLGFFKKNGLVECLFDEQIEDQTLNAFRDVCSIRSLRYNITIEKYKIDFESVLESVLINKNIE